MVLGAVWVGAGVVPSDVPSMDPARPKGKISPIFLNILNKEALMRKIQIFI